MRERQNHCLGSPESKSEAVFDAQLAPNRTSLRKNGQNGKPLSSAVLQRFCLPGRSRKGAK